MKTFYHGSPTPHIEVLEPRFDPRLDTEGIFIADEPFGPMMFALLPVRAHAAVDYTTKNGKFIEGKVSTQEINEEGWLYTFEVEESIIKERGSGQFYLAMPVRIIKTEKILKEDVLYLGWKIEIKPNREA